MALEDFALPQVTPLGAARGYNIADFSLTVFGLPIRELAKDTSITFEMPDGKVEFLEDMIGGRGVFVGNPSQKGILKFSLTGQGDDVNVFRAAYALWLVTRVLPVGPVGLTQAGDTWALGAERACINKFPPMGYGTGPDPVEISMEGVFFFTLKAAASI